jgi:hypothetical protein
MFSAQADVHNGSALLMQASVNGTVFQPLNGRQEQGVEHTRVPEGVLFDPCACGATTGTNRNDGGGGTGRLP